MQSRSIMLKDIIYSYEYMEKYKMILVFKDNKFAYQIDVFRTSQNVIKLYCSCPGARWHGHCHHVGEAFKFDFNSEHKPKSFVDRINSDFIIQWIDRIRIYGRR